MHILEAQIATTCDCRANGWNCTAGAAGEGSEYGIKGRTIEYGDESGEMCGRAQKRMGSTVGSVRENARQAGGSGGMM